MKAQAYLKAAIDFLRTQQAILVVLILALLAQLPHTAWVFQRISTTSLSYTVWNFDLGLAIGWVFAYVAATSVELAVLMFVVRGRNLYSWIFAGCSVLMNLFYYWQPTWSLFEFPYPVPMMSALLWSLLLPGAIALYSHEIKRGDEPSFEVANAPMLPFMVPSTPQVNADLMVPTEGNLVAFAQTAVTTLNAALETRPTRTEKPKAKKEETKQARPPKTKSELREEQVATLMATGKNNKEIALALGITESTVRGAQMRLRQQQQNGATNARTGTTNGTDSEGKVETGRETHAWTGETAWTPAFGVGVETQAA